MNILSTFRDRALQSHDFEAVLQRIAQIIPVLAQRDDRLAYESWRLKGDTLQEALLYPAFSPDGIPETAALAVLREWFRDEAITYVSLWDGLQDIDAGAAIACHLSGELFANTLEVSTKGDRLTDYATTVALVTGCAKAFSPATIEVSPEGYAAKQVFPDKPGVGWMLYLPYALTTPQVPEAQALIPVLEADKQIGTIVVSVIDEVFSMDNPQHIEAANRLEIRLVSDDLLPRYADI